MGRKYGTKAHWATRSGWVAGLAASAALLAFSLLSPVAAQETPVETPVDAQETPTGATETLVRIEIDAPVEPVPKGEEFTVVVLVENVEHVGSFDFIIEYDPDRVEPVEAQDDDATPGPDEPDEAAAGDVQIRGEVGEFLSTSERGESTACTGPFVRGSSEGRVLVLCTTLGPPLCRGAPPGASGSGVLGRVVFKSKGGDVTTLRLASSTLALDDLQPCDFEIGEVLRIPHRREDASVELTGGGGPPWVVIGPIIAVVVLVVAGGGVAGLLYYRRRAATSS